MTTLAMITFFLICYIPILVFSAVIPYLTGKAESFGVSIPEGEFNNADVKKIRAAYRTNVLAFGTVMAVFALFTSFFGAASATIIFLPVGVFIQIASMFVFYLLGNLGMKSLKTSNNWTTNLTDEVIIDFGSRTKRFMVSPLWFVVHIVIILSTLILGFFMYDRIPLHNTTGGTGGFINKSYMLLLFAPIVQIFMTFILAFAYFRIGNLILRTTQSNTEKPIEKSRISRYHWSAFIMFMGALILLGFTFIQFSFIGLL